MTDIEYRIADLINFSSNQKPVEFDQAFRSVMTAKVSDAIEARKTAVAQSMFNGAPQSTTDEVHDDAEEASEEEVDVQVA